MLILISRSHQPQSVQMRLPNLTPALFHLFLVSGSNIHDAARSFSDNSCKLARLRGFHTHLWGENRIVHRGEMPCSILDLALFDALNLNIRPDNIQRYS